MRRFDELCSSFVWYERSKQLTSWLYSWRSLKLLPVKFFKFCHLSGFQSFRTIQLHWNRFLHSFLFLQPKPHHNSLKLLTTTRSIVFPTRILHSRILLSRTCATSVLTDSLSPLIFLSTAIQYKRKFYFYFSFLSSVLAWSWNCRRFACYQCLF